MPNEVAAHEVARWACALGGAVLVHGAVLLGSAAEQVDPVVRTELPALVWLDASAAEQDPAAGTAGLALDAHPHSAPPRLVSKAVSKTRAKVSKPPTEREQSSAAPSSESAALSMAARSDGVEQAPSPLDAKPEVAAGELASAGAPAWGRGSLTTGAAGGGGSGGGSDSGAMPSNKPSFPPGLMAFGDPCRGFYPSAADVDHGEVRVVVRVGRDGSTRGSEVVAEIPARQGFGPAARACVSRLRFRPARDAGGGAIAGQAVLALSFDRS